MTAIVLFLVPGFPARAAAPPRPPELHFEAPEDYSRLRQRLEGVDPESWREIMELVGLERPGPPIRVLLVPEGSAAARRAPSWGVAYAIGGAGLVVLIPRRVPVYPDATIEAVLRHEVAHVMIARAAGRRPVPRWFDEGLAMAAARRWGLEDRSRVLWATLRYGSPNLYQLDRRFHAGPQEAARAYAFSGAFVRFLLEQYGSDVAARILDGLAEDLSFSRAFRRATGTYLTDAEDRFWRHLDFWDRWVPLVASSSTLWLVISALAVVAFRRRRARDAEMMARWREEEALVEDAPSGGWVH